MLVRNKAILTVHQRFVALFSILVLIAVLPVANVVWILGSGNTPDSVEFATKQYVTDGGFSLQQLSLMSLAELAADQQSDISDAGLVGSTATGLNEVVAGHADFTIRIRRLDRNFAVETKLARAGHNLRDFLLFDWCSFHAVSASGRFENKLESLNLLSTRCIR